MLYSSHATEHATANLATPLRYKIILGLRNTFFRHGQNFIAQLKVVGNNDLRLLNYK